MIIPHVIKAANGEGYSNGLMTKNGVFEYAKRKEDILVEDILKQIWL